MIHIFTKPTYILKDSSKFALSLEKLMSKKDFSIKVDNNE